MLFRTLQKTFIAIAVIMLMGHTLISHSHQHEQEYNESIGQTETNDLINYLRNIFSHSGDDQSLEETNIQNKLRLLKSNITDHASGIIEYNIDVDYTFPAKEFKLVKGLLPAPIISCNYIQVNISVIPVRGSPAYIA